MEPASRYGKIAYSISYLNDLAEDFTESRTLKLKSLIGNLWYEFLKSNSNAGFWLMGGDTDNEWVESETLVGKAFKNHVPFEEDFIEEATRERRSKDRFYNSYKILQGFCEIDRLLGKEKGSVYNAFVHVENIVYALCRYPDEWQAKYEGLHRLICTIRGEFFKIMKSDRDYVYAWMVHNLSKKVFNSDEIDIINKMWVNCCLPHVIKLYFHNYDEVFKAYKELQFREDLTVQERMNVTLLLTKIDKKDQETIIEMVKEHNKVNKPKLAIKKIVASFEKCKDNEIVDDRFCEFTANYKDGDKVRNRYES